MLDIMEDIRAEETKPLASYNTILSTLESNIASREDAYNALMEKEQNTLKILDRISSSNQDRLARASFLLNMSLVDVTSMFASTWKTIIHELLNLKLKSTQSLLRVFLQDDRKIVMGITCILIAVGIFFVNLN